MPQTFDWDKAREVGEGGGGGGWWGGGGVEMNVPRGSTLPVRLAFQDLYMPRQARMVTFKMVYAPSPASSILPIEHSCWTQGHVQLWVTIAAEEACVRVLAGPRGVNHCKCGLRTHVAAAAFPQGISAPFWASACCCERQLLPCSISQVPMHQQSCTSTPCCHAIHSKFCKLT